MGRSGTRFLAAVMNRSKKWTVRHEPMMYAGGPKGWRGHCLVADPKMVAARFDQQQYYGEVNSYLRHVLPELLVARRGVILRHPQSILVSLMNWDAKHKMSQWRVDSTALGYRALDRALQDASVVSIHFERMTTDVAYLQNVLEVFGIDDVQASEEMIAQKINAPKHYRIEKYADIPGHIRRYYEAQTNWYQEKYY